MAKRLTRREFLKLSGQALVATGTACALSGLPSPTPARAETPIALDGDEVVARVGDIFATIQLVPQFSKSDAPLPISARVRYGLDPNLASYSTSPVATAQALAWSHRGKHVGPDGSSRLVVSRKFRLLKWEIAPGDLIANLTDGSVMTVSQVVDNHKVDGTLSGGTRNRWNGGDKWQMERTYYRLEIKLTGLEPGRKYYYRVQLRFGTEPWQTPREIHSFQTRHAAGEPFSFAIWADPHRRKRAPEWNSMVELIREEQPDFLIDMGDSWAVGNGDGKPHGKHLPALYPLARTVRNGNASKTGISALCADCGYYLCRGNHEGLSDCQSNHQEGLLADLLRLFVPNPDGTTYPQGGSQDADYNQGYFAFEWGDALFVVLDCVKYKDSDKTDDSPARFHIGQQQLAWLTTVLANSPRKWKFVFTHHLFGGGDSYGRGGAAFAFEHEQAQIQALCEQHGAHIFHAHDHLLAAEMAHGVSYYCCGIAGGSGGEFNYASWADAFYPDGYIPPVCQQSESTCENTGYVLVDVSATQVRIRYKGALGGVIHDITLT